MRRDTQRFGIAVFSGLLGLWGGGCGESGAGIQASVAVSDITPSFETFTDENGNRRYDPDEPFEDTNLNGVFDSLWLPGRHPTGVHDPLWARSVALRLDDTLFTLTALDAFGVNIKRIDDIKQRVLSLVGRQAGLAPERMIIANTHTHLAPDTIGIFGGNGLEPGWDEEYLQLVVERAAQSIAEAVGSLEPAGDALATMVSIANHPEAADQGNTLVSSDFPHYLRKKLEQEIGGVAIYFSSDLGLMQTPVRAGETDFESALLVGEGYAEKIVEALSEAAVVPAESLSVNYEFSMVPTPLEHFDMLVAIQAGIIDGCQDYLYESESPPCDNAMACFDVPLLVVELGKELTLIAVPGEVTPELILGEITSPPGYGGPYPDAPPEPVLVDHLNTSQRFLIGLAGAEIGYIFPKMTYDPDNNGHQRHSTGPNAASCVMNGLVEMLDSLHGG